MPAAVFAAATASVKLIVEVFPSSSWVGVPLIKLSLSPVSVPPPDRFVTTGAIAVVAHGWTTTMLKLKVFVVNAEAPVGVAET